MRELDIFLGFVFEGAFKLGFLKGRIEEYEKFTYGIFEKIKESAQEDEFLKTIIEDISKSFPYEIHDPPENMKNLCKLREDYEGETEGETKPNWKELYTKLIFSLGYAGGSFYSKAIGEVELKKYHMGEESEDIIWQNADLVFVKDKTLYLLDFKLGGARNALREIITSNPEYEKPPRIPIRSYGIPVNISLGEIELKGFLQKFMKVKDKLRETEDVFVETKGFLQTLCYAVDFLCEEKEPIKEVKLELIYPMHEPLSLRFFVKNREGLKEFLEDIRKLYRDVKKKENPYAVVDAESQVRRKRLLKEIPQNIEELRKEMKKREKLVIDLPTGDIREARQDVKRRLEEFMKREEPCKAIALLHSAGSGKTSRVREGILSQKGKHIVLYMATRISLLDREDEKLKEIKDKNIHLVYERGQRDTKSIRDKGTHYESVDIQRKGKLQATMQKIKEVVDKNNPDYVWAFLTIQSVVETAHGNRTSEHLRVLLRPTILKNYHIHIILDEFFGYKNGLFAITEMFEFLEKVKKKGGKASLYLFDANGYSPNLLQKLIDEYKEFEVIPESIVLSEYQEEIKTNYEGIPFELYAKHGFPAGKLYIHKRFLEVKEEKEIPSLIAEYIKETREKSSSAFAFIQNKELIVDVEEELSVLGLTSLIATTSSRKSQEQINKGNEDVILGTSSVSRGLDFSRSHKPVDCIYIVVRDWGIEGNLVETIQAISRSRGDEETEKREKHLHLIYLISDQYLDMAVDKISSTLYHPDKKLVELAYKKEQLEGFLDLDDVLTKIIEQFLHKPSENVLVPIPTQHRSFYRHNVFEDYEDVINFLDDILYMEKEHDRIFRNFLNELLEWGYIYTNLPRLEHIKNFEYYHPYILYEEKSLFSSFGNQERQTLKGYLNNKTVVEILERHNKEKAQKVKEFVEKTLPQQESRAPLLMPIYSIVLVKNYLERGKKMSFVIGKRAGRGHAEVLGGSLEPRTLCFAGEREEYACIPLGEDYPYKEVLSGRFAKFPVKFIKSLLEG